MPTTDKRIEGKHKLRFVVSKEDELCVVAESLLSLFRTYGLNPELRAVQRSLLKTMARTDSRPPSAAANRS